MNEKQKEQLEQSVEGISSPTNKVYKIGFTSNSYKSFIGTHTLIEDLYNAVSGIEEGK